MGSNVTVGAAGTLVPAYLATPARPGPGVLVLPDRPGPRPAVRRRCDELAAAGFVALAPDLSAGYSTVDGAVDLRWARSTVTVAARQLRAHPAVRPERVGAVGYGPGARLALLAAAGGGLAAVVGLDIPTEPAGSEPGGSEPAGLEPVRCPVLLPRAGTVSAWAGALAFLSAHLRGAAGDRYAGQRSA